MQAGLFENYLLVDFRDPRLESILTGLQWFGFVDQLDRVVGETQRYEFKRYSRYLAAMFHLLFASRQYTKLVFPQMLSESSFKISRSQTTLQSMMSDIKCSVRPFLNCNILIMDILPMVLEIVQPHFRSVNVQLYSDQEKELLRRVVDIMRDYNLTYRQQRSLHGQYEFVLEPPVEEIVYVSMAVNGNEKSENKAAVSHKSQLSHTAKQVIAREIELAKVRNKEPAKGGEAMQAVDKSKNSDPTSLPGSKQPISTQNFLKSRLFHSKLGHANNGDSPDSASDHSAEESRLWFKYHAGCNNAIRRSLRISDLL